MEYAFPLVSKTPLAMNLITIADVASGSAVTIAPQRGALVTSFRVGDRELLYLDAATFVDPAKNVRGGVPVLFPTPGKLEGDVWQHQGNRGALPQHGFARNLPWTLVSNTTSSLTLELRSTQQTLTHYPWNFTVVANFTVQGTRLRITMTITNRSTSHMPFGLGYHPYFQMTDKKAARIDTSATRAFDNVSKHEVAFTGFDLTRKEVDLHLLDHGSQSACLHCADASIEVAASPDFKRWVVWTLAGKAFVCLEPWTSPGNALNSGDELVSLAPGQVHESWMEIGYIPMTLT